MKMTFYKLKNIYRKSGFLQNVITLMGGTALAQVLMVAVSPVLSRVYTPKDFAELAIFTAIVQILSVFATGRYELAIMLPKSEKGVNNLIALSIGICVCLSILIVIFIPIWSDLFLNIIGYEGEKTFLYLIAPMVLFIGINNLCLYLGSRLKEYKEIAKSSLFKSVGTVISQLSLLQFGGVGLVIGAIIGQLLASWSLFRKLVVKRSFVKRSDLSLKEIKVQANKYNMFPIYSVPAGFANIAALEVNIFCISKLFGSVVLGYYSFMYRILMLPLSLVSAAVGKVFLQEAVEQKNEKGSSIEIFDKVFKRLFMIGIPLFGLTYFIIEDAFVIVFGETWQSAGRYAQIMIPLFLIRFVVSPLSVICTVFKKQQIALVLQTGLLLTTIATVTIAYVYHLPIEQFLNLFTIAMVLAYIIFLFTIRRIAKGK